MNSMLLDHIPEEIWSKIILSADWLFGLEDSSDFLFLTHRKKTLIYSYQEEMGCIHRRYYTVEVDITVNSLETDKENFKKNINRFLSFGLVSRTTFRLISRLLSQRFLMEIVELLNFGNRRFGYNGRYTSPSFLHHASWLCQNLNTFIHDDFLLEYSRVSEYSLHRFNSDTKFFHFYCTLLKFGHDKAATSFLEDWTGYLPQFFRDSFALSDNFKTTKYLFDFDHGCDISPFSLLYFYKKYAGRATDDFVLEMLKCFFEKIQIQSKENPHSTRILKKHKLLNCGISTATLRGDLDSFQLFVSNIPLLKKCFQWEPKLTKLFNHTVRLKREKKVEIFLKCYKEYSHLFPDSNIGTLFQKELSAIV